MEWKGGNKVEIRKEAVFTYHRWTTADEMDFLASLGQHRQGMLGKVSRTPRATRLELLRGYRNSMESRSSWGSIDQKVITEAVDKMISEF